MTYATLMQVPVAIVADDLSGACDCGVEFVSRAATVTVHVSPAVVEDAEETEEPSGVVVYNTESRDMDVADATASVESVCRRLAGVGAGVVLKKGDSAFRGNFAEELAVAIATVKPSVTVVCPAIPDFGRTTIDGIQRIDGVPVDEGFYAHDPKHPARTSRVVELMRGIEGASVSHLPLATLRRTPFSMSVPDGPGNRIVVVDGENNGDLDLAAGLFLPGGPGGIVPEGDRVVFVGGQGIAAAIARQLPAVTPPGFPEATTTEGPVLVVAGSLHPATREQLALLERNSQLDPVRLPADVADLDRGSLIAALIAAGDRNGTAVLDTGPAGSWDPGFIETVVADICESYVKACAVRAVLLTGGSTAYAACRRLGVERLVLNDRVATGAVLACPLPAVTPLMCVKGGSLGEVDTMTRFVAAF